MLTTELYELNIDIPQEWEDFTDNFLYYVLAYRRDQFDPLTIDHIVDILCKRTVERAMHLSRGFWRKFNWTRNDAYLDMMEHIWRIAHRQNLKGELGTDINEDSFIKYFTISYRGHLQAEFRKMRYGKLIFGGYRKYRDDNGSENFCMVYYFDKEYTEKEQENANRRMREWKHRNKEKCRNK